MAAPNRWPSDAHSTKPVDPVSRTRSDEPLELDPRGAFDAASIRHVVGTTPGLQTRSRSIETTPLDFLLRGLASDGIEHRITVLDASAASTAAKLSVKAVYELAFSPKGSFLMTWERPTKDSEGNATKNLKIWSLAACEAQPVEDGSAGHEALLGSFVQRSQTGWSLQYTGDERYCARAVTNEVQVYESNDLRTVWNKLRVEGVSDFALSGGERPSIATFIPERKVPHKNPPPFRRPEPRNPSWDPVLMLTPSARKKGQPAAVKVFRVPEFSAPISQKTFFKGDKVQLKWNNLGTSLIVLAQTEVDKTGKSYYGETNLYLLSSNGDFDCRVGLGR